MGLITILSEKGYLKNNNYSPFIRFIGLDRHWMTIGNTIIFDEINLLNLDLRDKYHIVSDFVGNLQYLNFQSILE
jgi:hypothetical protein